MATFKELYEREKEVIIHGQSFQFRVIKYIVIITLATLLFLWKGAFTVGITFLFLCIVSIIIHFFFRWKTKGWTISWWLYKKPPLN